MDDDAVRRDNQMRTRREISRQHDTTNEPGRNDDESVSLTLSLTSSWLNNSSHHPGSRGLFPTPNPQPPPPPPPPVMMRAASTAAGSSRSRFIPPPFPWATRIRGKIHSLEVLESLQIATITGEVQCRNCMKALTVSYNLRERFREIERIFTMKKWVMRERAPRAWTNPEQRTCVFCGHDTVKPVIAQRKRNINWLFLLLGQTLGHCTLGLLKYFCKHSYCHRTGAKDRVLYLTYLGLCKMLDPNNGLFDL